MSTALGISAITAVLENLLNGIYNHPATGLGTVTVSAVAPDIIQTTVGAGVTGKLQVNLFLHQVTHNAAWRNMDLPALGADGKTRLKNQPLALDLHYLLTVYASSDCESEALLGYAVQFMHEHPVLARADIQNILQSPVLVLPSNPTLSGLLGASGLADQIEMIKITPSILGKEEMAWLWTAVKADYRLTFPFQVSVMLIQAKNQAVAPLPVASRNITAQAGLLSVISSITLPDGQAVASQGDPITINGDGLSGAVTATLVNTQLGIQYPITITNPGVNSVKLTVPTDASGLPAGVYLLSLQVAIAGMPKPISTNSLPLAVAPKISPGLPANIAGPGFTLSPTFTPNVLSKQDVSLLLGSTEVPASAFTGSVKTLSFAFTGVVAGNYAVRLRVAGVDSPVTLSTTTVSPMITVT